MIKVGLITFSVAYNIGSLLQTYALQSILKNKYDLDLEIINFSNKKQQEYYSLFYKLNSVRNFFINIIIVFLYPFFIKRRTGFKDFILKKLILSEKLLSTVEEVKNVCNKYEILICGSDQIWNTNCIDFDETYFLPFKGEFRKIAYAPSFGGKNPFTNKNYREKLIKLINDFDFVSIREKNGEGWLSEHTSKEISLVPDPTLLLDGEYWNELLEVNTNIIDEKINENYIFFYGIPYYKDTIKVLSKISKKYNLPIIMFDHKSWLYKRAFLKGIKVVKSTSPSNYLNLIKNARLIITSSFHGTIFSTIFKKDFWSATFKETNVDDDRLLSLLKEIGMEKRNIYFENMLNIDLLKPVNYNTYYKNVERLKEIGYSYLDKAIMSDKKRVTKN